MLGFIGTVFYSFAEISQFDFKKISVVIRPSDLECSKFCNYLLIAVFTKSLGIFQSRPGCT